MYKLQHNIKIQTKNFKNTYQPGPCRDSSLDSPEILNCLFSQFLVNVATSNLQQRRKKHKKQNNQNPTTWTRVQSPLQAHSQGGSERLDDPLPRR